MTTLQEFLNGEPLTYRAPLPVPPAKKFKKKSKKVVKPRTHAIVATYRTGDGIYLEDEDGAALGKAAVPDDVGAARAYYNLTRGEPHDKAS